MSINDEIRKLIAGFAEVRIEQEAELDKFRDGSDGEVFDWVRYGQVCTEHDEADAERYSELVFKLTELVGPQLKVGDTAVIPADITTASGGLVCFDGEVTAEVLALEDEEGDVLVRAQGIEQYVANSQVRLAK
ncbi:hypothetical protein ACFXOY_18275 [Streptomyces niveus]|uniref:hypothetical protein n=1 Tax=Streptomyces niveus TaxID=193462 RepID=UPI00369600DD